MTLDDLDEPWWQNMDRAAMLLVEAWHTRPDWPEILMRFNTRLRQTAERLGGPVHQVIETDEGLQIVRVDPVN